MTKLIAILMVIDAPFPLSIFHLNKSRYNLGRGEENEIVLPSLEISRYHATLVKKKNIETQADCYWIYDGERAGKKSTNGVFINGIAIDNCLLENNSLISFGEQTKLIYHDFVNGNNYLAKEIFEQPRSLKVEVSESFASKETIAIYE